MGNIVGEDHLKYVRDQISARQEILGKLDRTPEDAVWANGRTSWVRLFSSVNIADSKTLHFDETQNPPTDILASDSGSAFRNQYLGLSGYSGNTLAKEFILQAGTLNDNQLRYGIYSGSLSPISPNLNANYGLGGTEFGLRPMPGITGFSTNSYNNGSLRKAQITLVAHNTQQFKYIESLYLRIGYTMLVEWGNTKYPIKDSSGNVRYSTEADIAALSLKDDFFDTYDKGANHFYTRIEELREKSQGNYDGFLARLTNFTWEFDKNQSIKITLDLISIGSVVESLKINTNLDGVIYIPSSGSTANTNETDPDEERQSALEAAIDVLCITEITYNTSYNAMASAQSRGTAQSVSTTETVSPVKMSLPSDQQQFLGLTTGSLCEPGAENYDISCNAAYGATASTQNFYIRLGSLLTYINQKLLLYNSNYDPALIKIDTNQDTFCYSNGYSFSGDPTKMINKLDINLGSVPINAFPDIAPFHDKLSSGELVGRVMNLHFERDYLKDVIKNNTDEKGGLSLYSFLKELVKTANTLLGGVNKLNIRLTHIEENNVIKEVIQIYDEVPFKKIDTTPAFNVLGFGPNQTGGFVTDFSLKTSISKDLQTMIAVGAQAGGRAVGEDATLFSKWNIGLIDRITPTKFDYDKAKQGQVDNRIDFKSLRGTYQKYLMMLEGSFIGNVSSFKFNVGSTTMRTFEGYIFPHLYTESPDGQDIPTFLKFQTTQAQFFQKVLAYDAERKGITTPFLGFIPIDFSMTFDGLSGIRIFDRLKVNSEFLPENYGNTLDFIITQLDHKFDKNKWVTTVGTQSIPKLFDKKPEVSMEDIIGTNINVNFGDENRIYDGSEQLDSYFYVKQEIVRRLRNDPNNVSQGYRTSDVNDILQYLNKSQVVQDKFRLFFESLLQVYPKGYQFTINDVVRKLDSGVGVGLNSEHIWGLCIDMAVREARDTGMSQNILYGLEQTAAGQQRWNDLGIPSLGYDADLRWGGNFTSGNWQYDTVHFGALNNWPNINKDPQTILFRMLPKLKDWIANPNRKFTVGQSGSGSLTGEYLLSGIDLTDFLRITEVRPGVYSVTGNANRIKIIQGYNGDVLKWAAGS